jgi:aquaporin Z
VTLGFLVTRRIAPSLAVVYWLAQFAGGVLGALALRALYPDVVNLDQGVPIVSETINVAQAVGLEALLTFFLVWVVFATAADPGGAFKSIAGLAIGLTVTFDILAAGPLTGAAMNPARAFGPAVVANDWHAHAAYWAGPLLGAAVAGLLWGWMFGLREGPRAPKA